MKILILIIAWLTFGNNATAQEVEKKELFWIQQMSKYRDYLLTKAPERIAQINMLIHKWQNISYTEEELDLFRRRIYYFSKFKKMGDEQIVAQMKLITKNSALASHLTTTDVETIRENIELLELSVLGIIKKDYPFEMRRDSDYFKELMEYNIQSENKIGEIGAGGGDFSLLLHHLQPNVELYINELDEDDLLAINKKINNHINRIKTEQINLILGTSKSTNLEGLDLDKIILRNTFHHFTKKKKMLASIKRSLNEEGELFIHESIKELDTNGRACSKAMYKRQIVRILRNNGFELTREVVLGDSVLLKFTITQ